MKYYSQNNYKILLEFFWVAMSYYQDLVNKCLSNKQIAKIQMVFFRLSFSIPIPSSIFSASDLQQTGNKSFWYFFRYFGLKWCMKPKYWLIANSLIFYNYFLSISQGDMEGSKRIDGPPWIQMRADSDEDTCNLIYYLCFK